MIDWLELGQAVAPIFAALIFVLGGSLAYRRQRSIDRFEELLRKRREVYAAFLTSLSRLVSSGKPEAQDAMVHARDEVFIYGSDLVIRRVKAFFDHVEGPKDLPTDQNQAAYAAMVHAIRKDCFEASTLTIDELAKLTIHPGKKIETTRPTPPPGAKRP